MPARLRDDAMVDRAPHLDVGTTTAWCAEHHSDPNGSKAQDAPDTTLHDARTVALGIMTAFPTRACPPIAHEHNCEASGSTSTLPNRSCAVCDGTRIIRRARTPACRAAHDGTEYSRTARNDRRVA
ncbi:MULTISPECIES: hypothetical protein [Luteimonas]|uniref:hypothetical protein n=1 Tax=Luteimonas TaxID=83614 RepID=UPI00117D6BCD|nr:MULTISPECIES: hypothetical protein [Luteimonas]